MRLQELSERELRLLAHVTGGHVPFEVRFNLEQLETERSRLRAQREPAADRDGARRGCRCSGAMDGVRRWRV